MKTSGLKRKIIRLMKRAILLVKKLYRNVSRTDYTIFTFYAVLTGVIVGLATVFFHHSIEFFNEVFFEQTAGGLFFLGAAAVIVLPALGMFIQSMMILAAPEIASKKGVAEVIKAVATPGGKISLRTTLFHFLAPVISIGSGNTVGPEGPAAQLGGGVANKLAHLFKLSDSRKRVFTAAGSGAAIAAIFNTPMGGIFFALEIVLLNEFHTATFSAIMLACITSSAISRIFLGNKSVFLFHSPDVGSYSNLYLYAVLGILAGFVSLLFIRYSNVLDSFFQKKEVKKIPQWLIMTLIGLLVGVCGYFYKDIFGIGYNGVNDILSNALTWKTVAILLVLKFLLVPLVLNSGGFGGIFAPALFMGAALGFLYAVGLNYFFGFQFDVTAFILVSMGALLGGINSIPISSILIIFEMTKDYSFILPLMLAVVTSTMIVNITLKKSIHEKHLEKQGYRLAHRTDSGLLKSIYVRHVMKKDIVLIPEETPLPKVLQSLMESAHNTFYTINKEGKLTGTITESELRPIITEYEHIRVMLVARDIALPEVTTVNDYDDLDHVMKLFESKDADEFPVLNIKNDKEIVGTIRRQDVIAAYNKESLKHDIPGGFTRELLNISKTEKTKILEGYSVIEKTAPKKFIGKTLAGLRIRNRYGLEVLMIRHHTSLFSEDEQKENVSLPDAKYVIQEDDNLILFGADDKIAEIAKWDA